MTRRLLAPLLGLLLLSGCVREPEDLQAIGPDDLYARASEAYDSGDYPRAIEYLDAFTQQHFGDPRAPEARLMLGRAHMERHQYLTAATHFQRLVADYPASEYQIDARFGTCEAYRALSPDPPLDQEYTVSALLYCESIVRDYPESEQAQEAEGYAAELRDRLAQKVYDTGVFYMKRRVYDAAAIYLEKVLDEYPRSSLAPAALARLVEAYDTLGYVEDAEDARERLQRDYPESAEARALRAG